MAGRVSVSVNVKYNRLGKMKKNLPVQTSAAMRKAALATFREAVRGCPVDTGTLKNSIGTEGVYPGSLDMIVFTGAGYGAFVNFGTRFQAANPFMTRAAEHGSRVLRQELAGLVYRL